MVVKDTKLQSSKYGSLYLQSIHMRNIITDCLINFAPIKIGNKISEENLNRLKQQGQKIKPFKRIWSFNWQNVSRFWIRTRQANNKNVDLGFLNSFFVDELRAEENFDNALKEGEWAYLKSVNVIFFLIT